MQTRYDSNDRRLFERTSVEFPVEVVDLATKERFEAKCNNVSAAGIGLVASNQIPNNKPLNMLLKIPDSKQPYNVKAKAIWNSQQKPDSFRVGLEFHDIEFLKHWRIFRLPGVRKPIF